MKVSKLISNLFKCFSFHRKGLIASTIAYQKAKDEAQEKNRQTGHRYYVVWDPNSKKLFSITYDAYRGMPDSWQYLRFRGKMGILNQKQLKDGSFYYTSSRNGAKEMTSNRQQQMLEVLRMRYFCK